MHRAGVVRNHVTGAPDRAYKTPELAAGTGAHVEESGRHARGLARYVPARLDLESTSPDHPSTAAEIAGTAAGLAQEDAKPAGVVAGIAHEDTTLVVVPFALAQEDARVA